MEKIKENVQQKFSEIRNVLHMREKLLLRQADVIFQQQLGRVMMGPPSSEMANVKFLVEQEDELLTIIRNFGRFQLENMNLQNVLNDMSPSDYISPKNDAQMMHKYLQQTNEQKQNESETLNTETNQAEEAIMVDFSTNKSLIENMNTSMNESIINITLQEAKELIKKAKLKRDTPIPPLNLEELDDELESSIAEAVSSLGHDPLSTNSFTNPSNDAKSTKQSKKTQSSRFKPKITINNCNGVINLRNISSLTINCANENSISAQVPFQVQQRKQHEVNNGDDEVALSSGSIHKQGIHNESSSGSAIEENVNNHNESNDDPSLASSSSSNYSSSSNSGTQSKNSEINCKNKKSQNNENTSENFNSMSGAFPYDIVEYDDCDSIGQHAVSCDFYNRLLNEIKKSLRNKDTNVYCDNSSNHKYNENKNTETTEIGPTSNLNSNSSSHESSAAATLNTATTNTSATQIGAGRRLVLKNFENLRIVLEANSSDEETFHPVQIEQWLAEIISATDLEPMQNSEILEHSNIHNEKD